MLTWKFEFLDSLGKQKIQGPPLPQHHHLSRLEAASALGLGSHSVPWWFNVGFSLSAKGGKRRHAIAVLSVNAVLPVPIFLTSVLKSTNFFKWCFALKKWPDSWANYMITFFFPAINKTTKNLFSVDIFITWSYFVLKRNRKQVENRQAMRKKIHKME